MAKEKFREKIIDLKIINKKKPLALNESIQPGDAVLYKGQKGFIIGQAQNGDLLVQIQGSSKFVNSKDVKIINIKAKTMELPYKFDEKTQKVLFEQFVRCGIFMGNIPVKTTNCYVKYSNWKNAKLDEDVNVMADGELNILPKKNVQIFDDPNNFANPDDYVEGVIIDYSSGDAIENILINAIDYTEAIGSADPVKVIRGPESSNPRLETLSKKSLRTLSV